MVGESSLGRGHTVGAQNPGFYLKEHSFLLTDRLKATVYGLRKVTRQTKECTLTLTQAQAGRYGAGRRQGHEGYGNVRGPI